MSSLNKLPVGRQAYLIRSICLRRLRFGHLWSQVCLAIHTGDGFIMSTYIHDFAPDIQGKRDRWLGIKKEIICSSAE